MSKLKPPFSMLLVYPFGLRHGDGTTVQLRRLLSGDATVCHVHGALGDKFSDIPTNIISIQIPTDVVYPFRAGARSVRMFWRRFVVGRLAAWKLKRCQSQVGGSTPKCAYVVVFDDANAAYAMSVLKAARVNNYTLHLMDLFHSNFNPEIHRQLHLLIHGANRVLAVSPRLAAAIAPSASVSVEVFPLASGFPLDVISEPDLYSPTLIMSGALYSADPRKLVYFREILLPAFRRLRREVPTLRWIYTGADGAYVRDVAGNEIDILGLLDERSWAEALARCSLSILPVVHFPDDHYRYSLPSRIIDYFCAGVPVLAPRTHGTATADFLLSYEGRGAMLADTVDEAYRAMSDMVSSPELRAGHVRNLLECRDKFSLEHVRSELWLRLVSIE